MSAKFWKGVPHIHRITWDATKNGGAVGTLLLDELNTGFVITEIYIEVEELLVGGGTIVLGEDGGGDADGYVANFDALAVGVYKSTGALVATNPYKVDEDMDGLQLTIAGSPYTAGLVHFYICGFQGF